MGRPEELGDLPAATGAGGPTDLSPVPGLSQRRSSPIAKSFAAENRRRFLKNELRAGAAEFGPDSLEAKALAELDADDERIFSLRRAIDCLLASGGARGRYHALEYADAITVAEAALFGEAGE